MILTQELLLVAGEDKKRPSRVIGVVIAVNFPYSSYCGGESREAKDCVAELVGFLDRGVKIQLIAESQDMHESDKQKEIDFMRELFESFEVRLENEQNEWTTDDPHHMHMAEGFWLLRPRWLVSRKESSCHCFKFSEVRIVETRKL